MRADTDSPSSPRPDPFAAVSVARDGAAYAVSDGELFVCGGGVSFGEEEVDTIALTSFEKVLRMDLLTAEWSLSDAWGSVPRPRKHHAVVAAKASLLLFGGSVIGPESAANAAGADPRLSPWHASRSRSTDDPTHTSPPPTKSAAMQLYQLSLAAGEWVRVRATGDIPADRCHHTATLCGSTVLVCGGVPTGGVLSNRSFHAARATGFFDVFALHLSAMTWQRIDTSRRDPMRTPMVWGHSAALYGDTLAVFGGFDVRLAGEYAQIHPQSLDAPPDAIASNTTYLFNTESSTWEVLEGHLQQQHQHQQERSPPKLARSAVPSSHSAFSDATTFSFISSPPPRYYRADLWGDLPASSHGRQGMSPPTPTREVSWAVPLSTDVAVPAPEVVPVPVPQAPTSLPPPLFNHVALMVPHSGDMLVMGGFLVRHSKESSHPIAKNNALFAFNMESRSWRSVRSPPASFSGNVVAFAHRNHVLVVKSSDRIQALDCRPGVSSGWQTFNGHLAADFAADRQHALQSLSRSMRGCFANTDLYAHLGNPFVSPPHMPSEARDTAQLREEVLRLRGLLHRADEPPSDAGVFGIIHRSVDQSALGGPRAVSGRQRWPIGAPGSHSSQARVSPEQADDFSPFASRAPLSASMAQSLDYAAESEDAVDEGSYHRMQPPAREASAVPQTLQPLSMSPSPEGRRLGGAPRRSASPLQQRRPLSPVNLRSVEKRRERLLELQKKLEAFAKDGHMTREMRKVLDQMKRDSRKADRLLDELQRSPTTSPTRRDGSRSPSNEAVRLGSRGRVVPVEVQRANSDAPYMSPLMREIQAVSPSPSSLRADEKAEMNAASFGVLPVAHFETPDIKAGLELANIYEPRPLRPPSALR